MNHSTDTQNIRIFHQGFVKVLEVDEAPDNTPVNRLAIVSLAGRSDMIGCS